MSQQPKLDSEGERILAERKVIKSRITRLLNHVFDDGQVKMDNVNLDTYTKLEELERDKALSNHELTSYIQKNPHTKIPSVQDDVYEQKLKEIREVCEKLMPQPSTKVQPKPVLSVQDQLNKSDLRTQEILKRAQAVKNRGELMFNMFYPGSGNPPADATKDTYLKLVLLEEDYTEVTRDLMERNRTSPNEVYTRDQTTEDRIRKMKELHHHQLESDEIHDTIKAAKEQRKMDKAFQDVFEKTIPASTPNPHGGAIRKNPNHIRIMGGGAFLAKETIQIEQTNPKEQDNPSFKARMTTRSTPKKVIVNEDRDQMLDSFEFDDEDDDELMKTANQKLYEQKAKALMDKDPEGLNLLGFILKSLDANKEQAELLTALAKNAERTGESLDTIGLRMKELAVNKKPAMSCGSPRFEVKNLPMIPEFSGKYEDWPVFYASFEELVEKTDAADIIKFGILKRKLDSTAAALIMGYTPDQYDDALERLNEVYTNKHVVQQEVLKRLEDTPKVYNVNDLAAFRKLVAVITNTHNALTSADVQSDFLNTFYYKAINAKLPYGMAKQFIDKYESDQPVDVFVEWLQTQVRNAERVAKIADVTPKPYTAPQQNRNDRFKKGKMDKKSNGKPQTMKAHAEQTPECVFCKGAHRSIFCTSQQSAQEREEIRRDKNLCALCLYDGHHQNECRSNYRCRFCKSRHTAVLCFKSHNSKPEAKMVLEQTPTELELVQEEARPLAPPVIVELQIENTTINATYDVGSNLELLSSSLCKKLGIPYTRFQQEFEQAKGSEYTDGFVTLTTKIGEIEQPLTYRVLDMEKEMVLIGRTAILKFGLEQNKFLQVHQNCDGTQKLVSITPPTDQPVSSTVLTIVKRDSQSPIKMQLKRVLDVEQGDQETWSVVVDSGKDAVNQTKQEPEPSPSKKRKRLKAHLKQLSSTTIIMASTFTLCLAMFVAAVAADTPTSSLPFAKADPIIWRKTKHGVVQKSYYNTVVVDFHNPCEQLADNTTELSYLRNWCTQMYNQTFTQPMEGYCKPVTTEQFKVDIQQELNEMQKAPPNRTKRCLWIFGLMAMNIISAVSSIVGQITSTLMVAQTKSEYEYLNEQVATNLAAVRNTSELQVLTLSRIADRLYQLEKWQTDDMFYRMNLRLAVEIVSRMQVVKQQITSFFSEIDNQRISKEFYYLFPGIKLCGKDKCPRHHAFVHGCDELENGKYVLRITAIGISDTQEVLKADPFRIVEKRERNGRKEICFHEYTGNRYILYDRFRNCTRDILFDPATDEDPYIDVDEGLCNAHINRDEAWQQKVTCEPESELSRNRILQVKFTHSHAMIYCYGQEMQVQNMNPTICLQDVYSIERQMRVSVNHKQLPVNYQTSETNIDIAPELNSRLQYRMLPQITKMGNSHNELLGLIHKQREASSFIGMAARKLVATEHGGIPTLPVLFALLQIILVVVFCSIGCWACKNRENFFPMRALRPNPEVPWYSPQIQRAHSDISNLADDPLAMAAAAVGRPIPIKM